VRGRERVCTFSKDVRASALCDPVSAVETYQKRRIGGCGSAPWSIHRGATASLNVRRQFAARRADQHWRSDDLRRREGNVFPQIVGSAARGFAAKGDQFVSAVKLEEPDLA
jgi:hypothetical protein